MPFVESRGCVDNGNIAVGSSASEGEVIHEFNFWARSATCTDFFIGGDPSNITFETGFLEEFIGSELPSGGGEPAGGGGIPLGASELSAEEIAQLAAATIFILTLAFTLRTIRKIIEPRS